ncbi:DUF4868 domain-containing protein [Vibrio cyclitrophicus]|uniref:anti-phage protein KwaB n=1 Tax=Vibrio kanaloae TaxID=170673 RepID=UPI0020630EDD|nr:anti-phage protein KwaB [Vibrio cyclitrophicus]UPR54825.1 DUF4868 domain-containing protein [Vibrio cyclitrophicus]
MTVLTKGFEKFIDSCDGINVYFVDKSNNVFDSDIASPVLAKFRKEFCDEFRRKYTNHDKFGVVPLSNYDERKNTLYHFDFAPKDMPFEFKLTQQVLDIKATDNVPVYQAKNDKLSNISGVVILLKSAPLNKSMAFYQHIFPVSLLGPDKGLLNLTAHKTRLVELAQDVIKLNANFVFLQVKNAYFIEHVGTLETRLHFKEVIHSRAKIYSKKIEQTGLVSNMTKFNARIDKETSFARKVVKVYKNSVVIKDKIPNADIVAFTEKKDYYKALSAAATPTKDSFKLESIVSCKRFLDLLDDDFLKSELTQKDYISRVKDLAG